MSTFDVLQIPLAAKVQRTVDFQRQKDVWI